MATHSSFSQGSDEYYSLVCLPCHRDEETLPAFGYCINCQEHLCNTCYNHHKNATPFKHHQLQDKDVMPSTQQLTDTSANSGSTDDLTTPCPHNKELIKFYCRDHKLLLCSICVALKHTKPCHVQYIPEISGKIINSQYYNNTIDRIDELLKKCTTIKTAASLDAINSKASLKNALQEIMKHRQEIDKRLDELQNEIEAKLQALQQQNGEQMKTMETICDDVTEVVKGMYDNMKQLNTSKQADQLFIEVKQAQKQLQDYERSISSLSTEDCMDEYQFIPNQAINDVLQKEKMIGDISMKHKTKADSSSEFELLPPSADDTITPICLGEICVKTSKDKEGCWIKGMTVLPPDRLVLTDWNNNSIKLVDVNSKSIITHLSLGKGKRNASYDITSITSTQVAVTVPYKQHIQFLSVSNKLSKTHTIPTAGECHGLCCHQDKLVVTYMCPAKLEILDVEGRVITRVKRNSIGTDYVQANSSSIYLTHMSPAHTWLDNDDYEVIILNWTGEITGRIADIGLFPGGLGLLGDGSLLVCDRGDDKVYKVSGCTSSKIVVQDVRRPDVVCVDNRGHRLYLSRCAGEDKLVNNILVYNI